MKNSVHAALRHYRDFAATGQQNFLHQANFVLSGHTRSADMNISFLRMYVANEMGNFSVIEDGLAAMRPHRSAMKNQDAALYAYYLYFSCILSLSRNKERAAGRHNKALIKYCGERKPIQGHRLLAEICYARGDFDTAVRYLHMAYKNGDRSPFFYICLARMLEHFQMNQAHGGLLPPLMRWGLGAGYPLEAVLNTNRHLSEAVLARDAGLAQRLYAAYPLEWILHIICEQKMADNDMSAAALAFYKEAEARQLHFHQLPDFLVRAAHKNGAEDISRYTLERYLAASNTPGEVLPFVYHLAAKTAGHDDNIIDFACCALDGRLFGRYYYSLYAFLLKAALNGHDMDEKYAKAAEEAIGGLLFAYDITFDDNRVKKVLIQDAGKQAEVLYDVQGLVGRIRVNLCNADAKITCFDETLRSIIQCGIKMQKLVENVDEGLLWHFYHKGNESAEMLMALPGDNAAVLEKIINHNHISRAFKTHAQAALGNHYARQRNFARAAEYYQNIDENKIDTRHAEHLLAAHIHNGQYERAADIIVGMVDHISEKALFAAMKRLAASPPKSSVKNLAALARDLLIHGWFDKGLLNMVLEHHAAGLAGWIDLAKTLYALGAEEEQLYVRILETAISVRNSGSSVQGIFAKMTEKAPGSDIVMDFALYLSCEIIIRDILPEYIAIYAMEQVFDTTAEPYIAYALAHIYIRHAVATANSVGILAKAVAMAAEDGIIWPVFKHIKDKNIIMPYIEANAAFLHTARPDSTVTLYCRPADVADFTARPMKYLRFGLFVGHVPHFYGEELEYYFEEIMPRGSITTAPAKIINNRLHLLENSADMFYIINSALIYEQMFKYDNVEEIVSRYVAEKPRIRSKLM